MKWSLRRPWSPKGKVIGSTAYIKLKAARLAFSRLTSSMHQQDRIDLNQIKFKVLQAENRTCYIIFKSIGGIQVVVFKKTPVPFQLTEFFNQLPSQGEELGDPQKFENIFQSFTFLKIMSIISQMLPVQKVCLYHLQMDSLIASLSIWQKIYM